jgi:hypothetical protein
MSISTRSRGPESKEKPAAEAKEKLRKMIALGLIVVQNDRAVLRGK